MFKFLRSSSASNSADSGQPMHSNVKHEVSTISENGGGFFSLNQSVGENIVHESAGLI